MKIKYLLKATGKLFKETFREFIDDNAIKLSAALSCYTIFSLPPLLIIIISLSGFFSGAAEVSIKGKKYQLKLGEGIVIPAHAAHMFNANEQFKMITTIIKSGYEE